ncbi:protein EPIDERMAL PATTERNING FACTOR 2-like [Hordeum vulgare subsp. vulgare]|uniref:Epidermal patterning factor-like protein n=2 Tax=Hordeum vulgare TaxID=4513 RepID=A0A8I6X8M2_HORVV|nr:protein EPIDERMAL PATTERNING FACTOR 2-like [Hordeum vulgare subsp. vulgare]
MRKSAGVGALALALALAMASCSCVTHGTRTTPSSGADALQPGREATPGGQAASPSSHQEKQGMMLKEGAVTGSRLPDCAHACGACAPCKRVMVSFRCAEASESCPIAYRCMCRGRFFRVPTL